MDDLRSIVKKEYIEGDRTLCFETTPIWKIIFLSIISFGVYDFILFYRYWKTLKENFGYKINSFARGFIFGGFYNFALFKIFAKYMRHFNVETSSPDLLALIYLLLIYMTNSARRLNSFVSVIVYMITMWGFFIIVYYQKGINTINEQYFPEAKVNKWSVINTIWAIPLVLLFLFSMVADFYAIFGGLK